MTSKLRFIPASLCILICLTALMRTVSFAEDSNSVHIAVASDLHYIAPQLTDRGTLFSSVAGSNDGKLMLYTEEILDAFIARILEEMPDALILSGDLSYNGEYESHVALAEKLNRLQRAGIQVLVLSGNHDVNSPYAFMFHGESYEKTRNTTAEEFAEIYRGFGLSQAISIDEVSGSYVYQLRDDLRILMLDTNSVAVNSFPSESITWLEEQLQDARNNSAKVIAVSHQNLKVHHPLFVRGYRISNATSVEKRYREYGVLCQLSGHMHIQHIMAGRVPEILTSPLCMTPVRYGLLTWDGETLLYDAEEVDVEAYAESTGSTDENLLHFSEYARNRMYQIHYDQIIRSYRGDDPDAEAKEFAALFAETNYRYFTGQPIDRVALAAEIEKWKSAGPGFRNSYLEGILNDDCEDALHYEIKVE